MKRVALVVEDDPGLQAEMARHLEQSKFLVLRAFDFEAAVRHLTTLKPDVACVDLGLPSESGYELCEHIRSRPNLVGLPIIVTSDRGFPEDMAHAEEAGANAFLKKPFSMAVLLKYVSTVLDGPAASRPSVRQLRLS
jgi:DNA-binding response OmpR family regulator